MKYIVKCKYCEHSYIINENEKDFQCETCGGQNTLDDIVERIEEPVIVEKEVVRTVVIKKKEEEPDFEAIKIFQLSSYKLDKISEEGWNIIFIVFVVIAGVILEVYHYFIR